MEMSKNARQRGMKVISHEILIFKLCVPLSLMIGISVSNTKTSNIKFKYQSCRLIAGVEVWFHY